LPHAPRHTAGSYHHLLPKVAPDALRELAKSFKAEDSQVKLQVLNLACKLYLAEPATCEKLFRYVMDMARYDMDFDIRDRARMMRGILLGGQSPMIKDKAESIFLSARTAPEFVAPSKGKGEYVLNTLSHVVSHQVSGYIPIGDHPEEVPDAKIREPVTASERSHGGSSSKKDDKRSRKEVKDFYKDESSSGSDSSGSDSGGSRSSASGSDSDSSSDSDSNSGDSDSSSSDSSTAAKKKKAAAAKKKGKAGSGSSSSDTDSSDSADSSDDSSDSSDSEAKAKSARKAKLAEKERLRAEAKEAAKKEKERKEKEKEAAKRAAKEEKARGKGKKGGGGGAESLIELGDESGGQSLLDQATPKSASTAPTLTMEAGGLGDVPSGGGKAAPATPTGKSVASVVDKSKLLSYTLLHFANGGGLNVEYCFTREDSFYGAGMNTIKLVLHNTTNLPLSNVRVGEQRLEEGMELQAQILKSALFSIMSLYSTCTWALTCEKNVCSPSGRWPLWRLGGRGIHSQKYPL